MISKENPTQKPIFEINQQVPVNPHVKGDFDPKKDKFDQNAICPSTSGKVYQVFSHLTAGLARCEKCPYVQAVIAT